jgi:hypothetical protein
MGLHKSDGIFPKDNALKSLSNIGSLLSILIKYNLNRLLNGIKHK